VEKLLSVGPHGPRTRHRALGLMQDGSVLLPSGSPDQVWRTPLGLLQCFDVCLGSVSEQFSLTAHLSVPVHERAVGIVSPGPDMQFKERFAGLGENGHALNLLEKACREKSWDVMWYLKADPRMDSLRSEPRFIALAQRMGFSQ
jgi:hypothetical protein